jgi:hypothetical protein
MTKMDSMETIHLRLPLTNIAILPREGLALVARVLSLDSEGGQSELVWRWVL